MLCARCRQNPRLSYHAYCRECVNAYGREKRHARGLKPYPRHVTHGRTHTVEYKIWEMMKQRCFNSKNTNYALYGGRGITVCKRWMDFANFLADMGPRPTPRHSLDRYPNRDGHYEPGNVRWATSKEQNRNLRRNKRYTYTGLTLTLPEWSERLGIPTSTLYYRIERYGWTLERALSPRNT